MAGLERHRPAVIGQAVGEVLEIGVGTGLNLPHYRAIDRWQGVEPDPHMAQRARVRLAEVDFPAELHELGAEQLPFEDDSFDTIIATWVFCTIPEPGRAAAEIARVLRPDGKLVWVEHVGAPHRGMRALQSAIEPLWGHLAGGCHLTRDPVALFEGAGLEVTAEFVGPTRFNPAPHRRGVATLRQDPA